MTNIDFQTAWSMLNAQRDDPSEFYGEDMSQIINDRTVKDKRDY
jgi:hypothetical protein